MRVSFVLPVLLVATVWCVSEGLLTKPPLRGMQLEVPAEQREVTKPGAIWSNCGNANDMSVIDNITITPNPPTKAKPVTIDAWFVLKENITGGSMTAKLKYGFLPIKQTIDLCSLTKTAGMKCPIAKTLDHIHVNQTIPFFVPKGHITGQVTAVDQNGKRLGCVNIDVHIS